MALIDVTDLLTDPDFTDPITIISRTSTVDAHGENQLADTSRAAVAVVEAASGETLKRLPAGAVVSDYITVYTNEHLVADSPGGYADVVQWQGKRYQVQVVTDWTNWGPGWTQADCLIEKVSL